MKPTKKKVVISILLLIVALVVEDRLGLIAWKVSVERYADRLKKDANAMSETTISYDGQMIIMTKTVGEGLVPLLSISFRGPRPSSVTVDGNGGLNIEYLPPWYVWSQYLPTVFLDHWRPHIMSTHDERPELYEIKITSLQDHLKGQPLPRPKVRLQYGLPF